MRAPLLVSACLAGYPCRWDGKAKTDPRILELAKSRPVLLVCPEQLGGLGTPREPAEARDGRVYTRSGLDVTEEFERGARITLSIAELYGCRRAVLKARSPSCGSGLVYDGSFSGALREGDGRAAALLKAAGIMVESEEEFRG